MYIYLSAYSGTRQDLIERLKKEAVRTLSSQNSNSEVAGDHKAGPPKAPTSSFLCGSDIEDCNSESSDDDPDTTVIKTYEDCDSSDDFVQLSSDTDNLDDEDDDESSQPQKQRRKVNDTAHSGSSDDLETILQTTFGYAEFRPGQRWAIERCLQGQRSLLVMPTGAGKSLCYMIPALRIHGTFQCIRLKTIVKRTITFVGLTIVVSPLISLMRDQLKKLPVELPGVCFSGKQTAYEIAATTKAVLQGHVKVVFVSPERLCAPSFRSLVSILKQSANTTSYDHSPAVGLVCIDEAHCLSQWSYNFRPSFLRIRREIDFIRPGAVLALTATANSFIQKDIMHHLGIGDTSTASDCVLSLPNRRTNLRLMARLFDDDDDRFEAVLKLVKSALDSSSDCPELIESADSNPRGKRKRMTIDRSSRRSILPLSIVYVWRRDQVDSMCEYLKSHGIAAVAYHAGMDSEQREKSQRMFDNGTARCVVATVAFGMGVDKADVRQVIHCYMVYSYSIFMYLILIIILTPTWLLSCSLSPSKITFKKRAVRVAMVCLLIVIYSSVRTMPFNSIHWPMLTS